MLCEKCQQREAGMHLTDSTTLDQSGGGTVEEFVHHFCHQCGAEHVRTLLHPPVEAGTRRETVRVMSVSPEHTILRLVRTEDEAVPEDWSLLTARLGTELPVGEELQMTFTELQLEWLQGRRDTP